MPSEHHSNEHCSKLARSPGDYWFIFDCDRYNSHRYTFAPGEHTWSQSGDTCQWVFLFERVRAWASYVARELKALDYLAAIEQARPLSNAGLEQVGNEPFTEQEQSLVLQGVDRIETFLLDHAEVTDEQHAAVQREFELIREEARRSGRKSFYYFVFGALTGIIHV